MKGNQFNQCDFWTSAKLNSQFLNLLFIKPTCITFVFCFMNIVWKLDERMIVSRHFSFISERLWWWRWCSKTFEVRQNILQKECNDEPNSKEPVSAKSSSKMIARCDKNYDYLSKSNQIVIMQQLWLHKQANWGHLLWPPISVMM